MGENRASEEGKEADLRRDSYQRTRDDLLKRMLSNSENFDRAILTLSSASLGLSLTFIKDVVSLERATFVCLLIACWVLFVVAIVLTLLSFHVSQWAIKVQLDNAEKYYLDRDDSIRSRRNRVNEAVEWLGYVSSISFVFAIVFLSLFISLNIFNEEKAVTKNQQNEPRTERGASLPNLEAIPPRHEEFGAVVPNMEIVPPTSGTTNESGGGAGTDAGKE